MSAGQAPQKVGIDNDEARHWVGTQYASLAMTPRNMELLFGNLLLLRQAVLGHKDESPLSAFLHGWERRHNLEPVLKNGRAQLADAVADWLPYVVALTDAQVQDTLAVWVARAKAAVANHRDRTQVGVRA